MKCFILVCQCILIIQNYGFGMEFQLENVGKIEISRASETEQDYDEPGKIRLIDESGKFELTTANIVRYFDKEQIHVALFLNEFMTVCISNEEEDFWKFMFTERENASLFYQEIKPIDIFTTDEQIIQSFVVKKVEFTSNVENESGEELAQISAVYIKNYGREGKKFFVKEIPRDGNPSKTIMVFLSKMFVLSHRNDKLYFGFEDADSLIFIMYFDYTDNAERTFYEIENYAKATTDDHKDMWKRDSVHGSFLDIADDPSTNDFIRSLSN